MRLRFLVVAFLLASCATPRQQWDESLRIIKVNLGLIKEKAPEVTPEVTAIEDELAKVDDAVVKAVEEPSAYETYIPWALMGGGILMLWFGIKTPDPWDDVTGAIMCASSFIVAKYFDEISMWASGLLLLYLIIIGAKYYASRGTNERLN